MLPYELSLLIHIRRLIARRAWRASHRRPLKEWFSGGNRVKGFILASVVLLCGLTAHATEAPQPPCGSALAYPHFAEPEAPSGDGRGGTRGSLGQGDPMGDSAYDAVDGSSTGT